MFKFICFFISYMFFNSQAEIDFSLGEKVRVLSDKGYRYTTDNKFIAEGNVIIVSDENTLYGNKAKIYLDQQRFTIEDDVKLVNPDFSLLGEYFQFSSTNKKLELMRAVIVTDNYKVVGEEVSRVGQGDIFLKNASYTTCKDCPNSWSFLGENIFITPGEYVRIKGAYFVVNGVNVLYLPYFFFPIKKERESGFLFPQMSVNLNDGTFLQVPYFQTLGEYSDFTISPTLWGVCGIGGEFQFRRAFDNRNMIQFESKFVQEYGNDRRAHVSSLDFSFWSKDERLKLFAMIDFSNDYDSLIRFDRFVDQDYSRPDFGGEIRLGYTGSVLEAYVNISNRANILTSDSNGVNSDYVQTLPEIGFNFAKKLILDQSFFPQVSAEISFKFTQFRQNEFNQEEYSRNADRFIGNNLISINYGNLITLGRFKSEHLVRYINYDLKFSEGRKNLNRSEFFHFFNYELPLRKKIGVAEFITSPTESVDFKEDNTYKVKNADDMYVNNSSKSISETNKISLKQSRQFSSAFIHHLSLNFNYYHLGNVNIDGDFLENNQFHDSDLSPNTNGIFDYNDSIMTFENGVQANSTLSSLQRTNTLELLLVNNFFEQTPKENSSDNSQAFNTRHLGGFRISQGALIQNKYINETRLSRLLVGANTSYMGYKFDLTDSYFHDSKEHLLSLSFSKDFGFSDITSRIIYDSRTVPYNKVLNTRVGFSLNPEITISYNFSYDISVESLNFEDYVVRYLPTNDCWFLELNYYTDRIQSRYSFNFMLNLNEQQFKRNAKL